MSAGELSQLCFCEINSSNIRNNNKMWKLLTFSWCPYIMQLLASIFKSLSPSLCFSLSLSVSVSLFRSLSYQVVKNPPWRHRCTGVGWVGYESLCSRIEYGNLCHCFMELKWRTNLCLTIFIPHLFQVIKYIVSVFKMNCITVFKTCLL